ncbi:MAG TPA: FtsX-like permease family protein [Candidatus Saccharimonadales bacterium]|nr:FtsX-like permease family protein [Candidatus Saccharimonadales bacterium]
MIRLGLQLAFGGGREALVRLLAIAGGVMIGVALLLFSISSLQVIRSGTDWPCWTCTTTKNHQPSVDESKSDPLLWRPWMDIYKGNTINIYDVATKGPKAPIIPGLDRMPGPGEYYVSPALAKLLAKAPANQLDDRFHGKAVGQIGKEGLDSPDMLAAVVGYAPEALAGDSRTSEVRSLESRPASNDVGAFIQVMFATGAAGLLFAVATLITTATRLSAARREERFAALRLIGATPRQINQLAAVDAALGAAIGALAGIGLFYVLRPVFVWTAADFIAFFPEDLTPGLLGFLIVLVGTPLVAAAVAMLSLRRVRISPLGVVRRITPKPPRAWRVIPLAAGLSIMALAWYLNSDVHDTVARAKATPYFLLGFALILLGLTLAGSWLTMVTTRLLAKRARSASLLLAMRRLADNPKAAFRPVSVLVIATFLCSIIAVFAPLVTDEPNTRSANQNNSFAHFFDEQHPLTSAHATTLIGKLQVVPEAKALLTYAADTPSNDMLNRQVLVVCEDIERSGVDLPCPDGATALKLSETFGQISSPKGMDNEPVVIPLAELRQRPLRTLAVFWHDNNPATRERIRTVMAGYPEFASSTHTTEGEFREQDRKNVERIRFIVNTAFSIVLFVAGCSLAVAVGGSLIERKRPFGLLRVTGTSLKQLRRVVLVESIVPLAAATLLASSLGALVAVIMIKAFAAPNEAIHPPAADYYVVMLAGLGLSFLIISATLPILGAITKPENARFE